MYSKKSFTLMRGIYILYLLYPCSISVAEKLESYGNKYFSISSLVKESVHNNIWPRALVVL